MSAILYDKFMEVGVIDWWIGATDSAEEGVEDPDELNGGLVKWRFSTSCVSLLVSHVS